MDCAKRTVRLEGFSALYKGITPALLTGAPYVGVQMTLYQMGKTLVAGENGTVHIYEKLLIGAISGVVSQTLFYPGDTLRRRMQSNGMDGQKRVYSSTYDCMVKIVKKEGLRGFYGGALTNAARAIPGAALQFTLFDFFKGLLIKKKSD
jgi:hypothetical protein